MAMMDGTQELHIEVEVPNWATKVRCSCGHEEPSRAQMYKHQADALRLLIGSPTDQPESDPL